jgi:hypothetical protein
VIGYEHVQGAARVETRIKEAGRQLNSSRRTEADMEVCMPLQRLLLLAEGRGIWSGLSRADRAEQLATMARLLDELYPSFRLYLYDDLVCFSAPYTVFGTIRAAIYVGQMYLVVSSVEHIRGLTRHFDDLVRKAAVNAHETAAWIRRLPVA